MHYHISKSIITVTVSCIWDLRKVVAHKKNFRYMSLAQ